MSEVISAFSIDQVSKLTGLSNSQLVDWDSSGFFSPSLAYKNRKSPYSRIYTFEDVVALRTLSILRTKVSMQHLREAAYKLQAFSGRPWTDLTLYVLNREVHFRHPKDGKIQGAVSGQLGATIPLESVAQEVRDLVEKLRERDPKTVGGISKKRFVAGGEAVISGTRILVSSVINLSNAGYSADQIILEYPDLTLDDIRAALDHKEELTRAA